jgi:hypothetical protein
LHNRTPIDILSGSTPDICVLLQFHFWQLIYCQLEDPTFPSNGTEKKGQFVGVADSVGGALTYKILTNDSHKILFQPSVRSALKTSETNLHLEPHQGESSPKPINFIKLLRTQDENSYALHMLPGFTPDDLIGRTSLMDTQDNGERFRARIARKILDPDKPHDIRFLVEINEGKHDEIIAYNEILDKIETDLEKESTDTDCQWKFKDIVAHQGPLLPTDINYKGSKLMF